METPTGPTPAEAAAALNDIDGSRRRLAEGFVLPRFFYPVIGTAVAVQILTTAVGLGIGGSTAWIPVVAGLLIFAGVAGWQLLRFRRLNGAWVHGLASRVVLGTATPVSLVYVATLAGAIWAATADAWWLVVVCALVGGTGYALAGNRWMRTYRAEPARHSRAESAAVVVAAAALGLAGAIILVVRS